MPAFRIASASCVQRRTCAGLLYACLGLLFLGSMARPAFAHGNDRVNFAQRIVVDENDSTGDLVCFLCSIEVHGNVQGNVVSFLGGVKGDGAMHGDVVSFLGDVNLSGNSTVDGQVVVLGGDLRRGTDVRMGQDQVVLPGAVFAVPLIFLVAILWGITRLFRRRPVYFRPLR
jgi:hypothetical protein